MVEIKIAQYNPYKIILYIILVENNLLYKTSFFCFLTTKRTFYSPLTVSESLVFLCDENIEVWQFQRWNGDTWWDTEGNRAYFSLNSNRVHIFQTFPWGTSEKSDVYHNQVEIYRIKASVFVIFQRTHWKIYDKIFSNLIVARKKQEFCNDGLGIDEKKGWFKLLKQECSPSGRAIYYLTSVDFALQNITKILAIKKSSDYVQT